MVGKFALAMATVAPIAAEHWAVIVAGSKGYGNYRHQADACHAYQVVTSKGIPASNIILMAYDDIANNSENPFPGKLFNKPDPNGPGKDVYEGCNIDYKGSQVTPQNFLDVLTGKASGKKTWINFQRQRFCVFLRSWGARSHCLPFIRVAQNGFARRFADHERQQNVQQTHLLSGVV